jgi:small subunit ribosomal protein S6
MALYEATFIARRDISTQDVTKLTDQFSAIITSNGGKVVKSEYWGLRNMAYKVKKNKKGHYVMLGLDAPSAAVKELERNLHLNEDVIRNLTIRVEEIEAGPSAPLKENERSDREFTVNFNQDEL